MAEAGRRTLSLVNLAAIMERADEALLPAVHREVGAALGATPVALGALTLYRSAAQAACYPLAAYAAVRYNRAHVVAVGALLWAAATFLVAVSDTFAQVAIARGLNGIGLALVTPAIQSLVADCSDDNTRGAAFGWLQLTGNIGSIIGAAGDSFQQLTSSALLRLQQDPSSYLSFQNLLDSQPSSQSIFGAAAGGFGQAASRLHDPAPSPSDFLASGSLGGLTHGGLLAGSEGLHLHHSRSDDVHGHGGDELSGVVAAGASSGSCKLNYSSHAGAATSSSAGAASADKPPDGGAGGAAGRPGRGDTGAATETNRAKSTMHEHDKQRSD